MTQVCPGASACWPAGGMIVTGGIAFEKSAVCCVNMIITELGDLAHGPAGLCIIYFPSQLSVQKEKVDGTPPF